LLISNNFNSILLEPRDHKFDKRKLKKLQKKFSLLTTDSSVLATAGMDKSKAGFSIEEKFTHVQRRLDEDFVDSKEGML